MSAGNTHPEFTHSTEGPDAILIPDRVLAKSEWPEAARAMVANALDTVDAPTAYVLLAQMEELIALAKKDLKDAVTSAAAGKKLNVAGATLEYRKAPAKWDYKGDKKLSMYQNDADAAKEALDAHKAMLQALTAPVYDTEYGYEILPAVKMPETFTVAVTFPKEA